MFWLEGCFNLEDPIFAGSLSKILLDSNKFTTKCDSLFNFNRTIKEYWR